MRAVQQFILDRLYPTVIDGLPVLGTPAEFAARFDDPALSPRERGEALVKTHVALGGATGFASGLGGWLTLPVALPAGIAGTATIQLHMAASVAALARKDPSTGAVRAKVLECLIGASPDPARGPVRDAEQETIDRFGLKLAERALNVAITGAIGAAKWGTKKVVGGTLRRRFLRGIPLVGGVIGAVSDGYVTLQIARNALDTFLDDGGIREPSPFPPASGDGVPENTPEPSLPSQA